MFKVAAAPGVSETEANLFMGATLARILPLQRLQAAVSKDVG